MLRHLWSKMKNPQFDCAAQFPAQQLVTVLLLAGLCGALLGARCGWQTPIESAQVLAGVVQYPPDNPFYAYHVHTWTLLHQVPALLLKIGCSEALTSRLLGAFVGAVALQSIALASYIITQRVGWSVGLALILAASGTLDSFRGVYPLRIVPDRPWAAYGVCGTAWVLLAWGMLAAGMSRCGAVALGLAPAVHPVLGTWGLIVALGAAAWLRFRRLSVRLCGGWMTGAAAAAAASFMMQRWLWPSLSSKSASEINEYLRIYADAWDTHRQAYPLTSLGMAGAALVAAITCRSICASGAQRASRGFLACVLCFSTVAALAMCLATHAPWPWPSWFVAAMPGRFVNLSLLALPALALGLLARSEAQLAGSSIQAGLAPAYAIVHSYYDAFHVLPDTAWALLGCGLYAMAGGPEWGVALSRQRDRACSKAQRQLGDVEHRPNCLEERSGVRMLILSLLCVLPAIVDARVCLMWAIMWGLAEAVECRGARWKRGAAWAAGGIAHAAFIAAACQLYGVPLALCIGAVAMTIHYAFRQSELWSSDDVGRVVKRRDAAEPGIMRWQVPRRWVLVGGGLGAAGCIAAAVLALSEPLDDWRHDAFFQALHEGDGLVATVAGVGSVQMRSRRPVLLEVSALNQLPYVPHCAPAMNQILKAVYGVDLLRGPPDGRRRPGIAPDAPRELWERRSGGEWRELAARFGFTDVLAYRGWQLQLPRVAESEKLVLYRVPLAAEAENTAAKRSRAAVARSR
jgi:hypothetical protein